MIIGLKYYTIFVSILLLYYFIASKTLHNILINHIEIEDLYTSPAFWYIPAIEYSLDSTK